jgi:hypothetical protein
MSMSLRNELRKPGDNPLSSSSYGWQDWYPNVESAAKGINSANSANNQVLIFFSGLNYDTDMSPIPTANNLGNFTFGNKLVLELHD